MKQNILKRKYKIEKQINKVLKKYSKDKDFSRVLKPTLLDSNRRLRRLKKATKR